MAEKLMVLAFADWNSGRGGYRLKFGSPQRSAYYGLKDIATRKNLGRAPWSKLVLTVFPEVSDFARAARMNILPQRHVLEALHETI